MDTNSYWHPTTVVSNDNNNQQQQQQSNQNKTKNTELNTVNQPTVRFANIFAGATAAAASGGVTANLLPGCKGFQIANPFPQLSQLSIPPASQLSKRNGNVFPITSLPSMAGINNVTVVNNEVTNQQTNMAATASSVVTSVVNNDTLQLNTNTNIGFGASVTQQQQTTIAKDYIQQAAAESGLMSTTSSDMSNLIASTVFGHQSVIVTSTPGVSSSVASDESSALFFNHTDHQQPPHKCPSCPESFYESPHLQVRCQQDSATSIEPFCCQNHIKRVHASTDDRAEVANDGANCGTIFQNGVGLNHHVYTSHTAKQHANVEQYGCLQCGKSFMKANLLTHHLKNVHGVVQQQQTMYNITTSSVQAANHMNNMRTTIPNMSTTVAVNSVDTSKQHRCPTCDKGFKTASYLRQHILAVHSKPHKCEECRKGFGRKSDLQRHMRGVHMRERPHLCPRCGWTFAEAGNLKHHLQAVHSKEKNHRCSVCTKSFAIPSYLKTHMMRVHGFSDGGKSHQNVAKTMMPTSLPPPNFLTATSSDVAMNRASNSATLQINNIQTPVATSTSIVTSPLTSSTPTSAVASTGTRCFECGEVFANPSALPAHVISTHPKPFWCTVCNHGFEQARQLQLHLQYKHNAAAAIPHHVTPQVCEQRRVTTATTLTSSGAIPGVDIASTTSSINQPTNHNAVTINTTSTNHMINQNSSVGMPTTATPVATVPTDHSNEERDSCAICGLVATKQALCHHACSNMKFQQNAMTLPSVTERPHLCTKCGKGFKTATHLKQHVRCVHSKERPFGCPQCGKAFARMSDLNRHVRGVHEKNKNSLQMSVAKSMRSNLSKCEQCDEVFSEATQLRRHMYQVHVNQRPTYKCADCQEGFPDSEAFNSHICHERERPHVCNVCSKRFLESQQLRRHQRSAHSHHGPINQHRCYKCQRKFTRPVDLNRHVHAVHLKQRPHKCKRCDKAFGLLGNLNKHVKAVHNHEKPHQCIECGKRFAHIGVLKRHLRDIHMYDKPGKLNKNRVDESSSNPPNDVSSSSSSTNLPTQITYNNNLPAPNNVTASSEETPGDFSILFLSNFTESQNGLVSDEAMQ